MRKYDPIKPDQDPAGKLAEMVINTKFEDFSPDMIQLAKKAIFDTIAVMIAGSSWECVPLVTELVKQWGGTPQSSVLIYGDKVSAPMAAFANGVMARSIDMGDVHETGGHVTEWIIPTLLAALGIAKHKITGRDFITAYIVAAELGIRQQTCIGMKHTTNGIPGEYNGPMYCTAAASRLLGSNVEQTWHALGMAYSVHGMSEMQKYAEGSQMARLQHAFAGDTGIKATLLAQGGATGLKGIYMGVPGGSFRHIEWDDVDPDILTEGLGTKWLYSEGLSQKPYASCKYTHSFISAISDCVNKNHVNYKDIIAIHCVGSEGALLTIEPKAAKWNPSTAPEAMFSTPYTVAHAAINGHVFLDAFSEKEINQPEKRELMKKIRVDVDPQIQSQFEGFSVEVTLQNGHKYKEINQYVLGHTNNPMSWNDLENKFWNCVPYSAVPLPKEQFQTAIELCYDLDKLEDMNLLVKALTPIE